MKAWTYIIQCSNGTYYTGSTTNLEQRISEHNTGKNEGYTSHRLPVALLWSEEFIDIRDASILERQIKGWSRKKKEALMRGDYKLLHDFSRSTYAQKKNRKDNHPSTHSSKKQTRLLRMTKIH